MFALVAAFVLSQTPSPTPIVFVVDEDATKPALVGPLARGVRDAFQDSSWRLSSPTEREASAMAARDAGTQIKGAPALLLCTGIALGPQTRFSCRLASVADQRALWNGRQACGSDLPACARDLGQQARAYLDAHPPSYKAH